MHICRAALVETYFQRRGGENGFQEDSSFSKESNAEDSGDHGPAYEREVAESRLNARIQPVVDTKRPNEPRQAQRFRIKTRELVLYNDRESLVYICTFYIFPRPRRLQAACWAP